MRKREQYNEAEFLTVSEEIRIRFNETDPLGIVGTAIISLILKTDGKLLAENMAFLTLIFTKAVIRRQS